MKKPFAISLDVGSSLANRTGSWRTERPVYVDRLPPCNATCAAGENIQQWLFHAEEGAYEAAWRVLTRDNPLPAIMGRVCYHPCESACNRGLLDESVGINSVERFLGDQALQQGWTVETAADTGKRVMVVGSGPAGLSAAYHLRRLGHAVTIFEAEAAAGGMMRYGIPQYRLPRDVLDAEIERILGMGVELCVDTGVDDVAGMMRDGHYDACFLGIGAHIGKRAYIPAGDANRITDAVSLLHNMAGDEAKPLLGRRVVVYGGGNTAVDVARTARRLGAEDSIIVYRRTREKMPAHLGEVQEAVEEGVKLKWLTTIKEAEQETIKVERMELDADGFPQPTGEYEVMPADSVVLALGQDVDTRVLEGLADLQIERGIVRVGQDMMTDHPGIFAGGDMVAGDRTVTVAVGHGKKAARAIDAWLHGERYVAPAKPELATFERLNTWYYADAEKTVRPMLDVIRRQSTFDEVRGGLDESNALYEARRCLSCGNCFECDTCYGVCPDNAVIKLGPGKRFSINYDYCKGCGLCVAECPCGAIRMEPEEV